MGLLTDLVIAQTSEAADLCAERRPADRWPCLELRRLDNSKLAALAEAWNDPAQATALEGDDCLVATGSDEGPWVFEIPTDFRDRLAHLERGDLAPLASSWAEQPELKLDGWMASDVEELLQMMQAFAADAVNAGRPLLLKMAL